jgi:SNF2 family DNA or RNA helicase
MSSFHLFKIPQRFRPKPGFPLNEKQQQAKALVLDEESGTKIPAAINTYLRDYQRDGVRFLWRQYNEGRGGLLGDDMGLVSGI